MTAAVCLGAVSEFVVIHALKDLEDVITLFAPIVVILHDVGFLRGFFWKVFESPPTLTDLIGQFLKFGKFGVGEKKSASSVATLTKAGFNLSRKEAFFVSVT